MIPKIVHYCWLSDDPVPTELQKYMESWKKYLPDYEFVKWDFSRFSKNESKWVSDAFDKKSMHLQLIIFVYMRCIITVASIWTWM